MTHRRLKLDAINVAGMDQEYRIDIEWPSDVWLNKEVTRNLVSKLGGFLSYKIYNG